MNTNLCEYLQWDSDFFGLRIGRVIPATLSASSLSTIEQWCDDQRIDCLYLLSGADDLDAIWLAEDRGFRFVDIRVLLENVSLRGSSIDPPQRACIVRASRESDVETLSDIAAYSHRDTRFYADPHFSRTRCDAFYRAWIANSCRGWASTVLVAELAGQVCGYVTCHLEADGSGRLGLVAVAEEARRHGLGRLLTSHALAWFAERGVARGTVFTQGRNLLAHRLYMAVGFRFQSMQVWHHRWFSAAGESR